MIEQTSFPFRESPQQVLSLDYYDGPLSGLAEYGDGAGVYQFRLVSNPLEEPRFYALSPSPLKRLADLEAELQVLGAPKRPVWNPIWKFVSKADESKAALAVDNATPDSDPIAIVVAQSISRRPLYTCSLRDKRNLGVFQELSSRTASIHEWEAFVRQCSETE